MSDLSPAQLEAAFIMRECAPKTIGDMFDNAVRRKVAGDCDLDCACDNDHGWAVVDAHDLSRTNVQYCNAAQIQVRKTE